MREIEVRVVSERSDQLLQHGEEIISEVGQLGVGPDREPVWSGSWVWDLTESQCGNRQV